MAQITIGSKFFRNEARSYSNVASAFWRELIQNSVDNGATAIDIKTQVTDGNREIVRVTFSDNGTGMDRATLEKVYFCLGETTKGGAGDIGGFGRARLLTCFAQEAYTIRTQNVTVMGSGAEYEIEETSKYHRGCEFDIEVHLPTMRVANHSWDYSVDERLLNALTGYLCKCQFNANIEVTINGVTFTDYLMKRTKRGDLSFGTIHVVKKPSRHGGQVYVRVRGALMFEENLYGSNALVVVEIDPAKSREVLVSNRDSLNWQYKQELDALIQSLAVNNLSGLDQSKTETVISAGGYRAVEKRDLAAAKSAGRGKKKFEEKIADEQNTADFFTQSDLMEFDGADRGGHHENVPRARMTSGGGTMLIERNTLADSDVYRGRNELSSLGYSDSALTSAVPSGMVFSTSENTENARPSSVSVSVVEVKNTEMDSLTQGMYFILDTEDTRVRAAARKWQQRYLVGKGPGRNRRKLLAQWIVACEWALSAMMAVEECETVTTWAPGVYFKSSADAGYMSGLESGSHVFMFNPLDTTGRIRYELDSIDDHAEMLASAAHEVCHASHESHNEGFSSLLTNVMGKLFPHMSSIHREMMSAG